MGNERRGRGEGSIYRRKDGRWVGQYDLRTDLGKKTKYIYGKTRKEVATKLTKAMADKDAALAARFALPYGAQAYPAGHLAYDGLVADPAHPVKLATVRLPARLQPGGSYSATPLALPDEADWVRTKLSPGRSWVEAPGTSVLVSILLL